ncbi:MAG TPA: STT3 domain-containing protein, partial [Thermoplasmata archaeon]
MGPLIEQFGPLYLYGGGSDSFYHSRVMTSIIANHSNLVRDQLLNYPLTAVNPREPLFDWMNAISGMIFAPFFGGSAPVASAWFLDLQGPLWAALGVFPVYLIGREVSSKRMGIVAAFLYPLMVANIDSSTFGYANYLSFYTFFILLTIFGFLKTIRTTGTRRWVESYRHPRQIPNALRQFARVERTSVKWAVFTGVSFGTLALAWQGYSFAVATIVIFLLFALIVERIRRVDSFGLYVNTWIVGLVGFPMAVPYFYPQGLFAGWFDLPLLVYFGALLVALPFVMMRDSPWVVSIPVLLIVGGAAIGVLDLLDHQRFVNIVTGQGYFVKTLVYSTVAEAQAPSIDALILGYGVVTFFLAFVGLGLLVWRMTRQRFPRALMMFLVFGVISIYLPVSAAKFFYLGSAGFALLAAEGILRLLDVATYPELRRTVGQLSDRRGKLQAFRKSFKARHVLVMALVLVLVLPNIWYAVDAGIPYNSKSQYNQQIYNTLPSFLRPAPQNASQFFLGAAGTQLDTPTQYDEAGYNWLSLQDQNLPAPQRPAFISWWDYGFQ